MDKLWQVRILGEACTKPEPRPDLPDLLDPTNHSMQEQAHLHHHQPKKQESS